MDLIRSFAAMSSANPKEEEKSSGTGDNLANNATATSVNADSDAIQLQKEKEQLEQELDLLTNEIQNHRDELLQEQEKQDILKPRLNDTIKRIDLLRKEKKDLEASGRSKSEFDAMLKKEKESKEILQDLEEQVEQCQKALEELDSQGLLQNKDDKIQELQEQLRQVTQELEGLEKAEQQSRD